MNATQPNLFSNFYRVAGESIVIGNEIMLIEPITADAEITFHDYHLHGTSGAQVLPGGRYG